MIICYIKHRFEVHSLESNRKHISRKGCVLFMLEKLKDKWTHRKWSLLLFYDGILIKKVKISEDTIIKEQVLSIKVYGHKTLFGKNNITLMVRPTKLLKTEVERKRTYWGVVFEKGVDV